MHAPGIARAAAALLALEGVALVIIAGAQILGLGAGQATSVATGIALIVLTLVGAAALLAFAFGTSRGRTWARSGGVLAQVLAVALALASVTLQPVPWTFVVALGVPGVIGFVLLIASARRDAAATRPDANGAD